MRDFQYTTFGAYKWDNEVLSLVAEIHKHAGKQEFYIKQRPYELDRLVEIAKIQSTESSNEIEGIITTSTRLKQLVEEKTTPRNRNEQEIAGYRDVLNIVHDSYDSILLSPNYILQLHKILYRYMNNGHAGRTKSVQNYISSSFPDGSSQILFTPLSPLETPIALEKICDEYNKLIGNAQLEPLIAIPIFIHDFLCIHPFNDGNGRMSRILTTLLLYQSGFFVGKYISLEAKISQTKDWYYASLQESGAGWHENQEDILPFLKYILGIILSAYKDFEERFSIVEDKVAAIDMVRKAVLLKIGKFTKQDIMELCPALSISSVEASLKKLVLFNEIERHGKGKATYYLRKN